MSYSGDGCPKCQERGVDGDIQFADSTDMYVHIGDSGAWQDWWCRTCGFRFRDVFVHVYSVGLDSDGEETDEVFKVEGATDAA